MSKYILMIATILLLNNFFVFSQDIIDPPKLNQLDTLSILQREPDRFVRGWTCGSQGNMLDSAMYINTYYGYSKTWFQEINKSIHNVNVIDIPGRWNSHIVSGRNGIAIFNTMSLYLEPALTVDTTQAFEPADWNKTGAVFGFRDKSGICLIDTNNNGQIRLDSASIGLTPVKVLSNIWKNDCLHWLDYYDKENV